MVEPTTEDPSFMRFLVSQGKLYMRWRADVPRYGQEWGGDGLVPASYQQRRVFRGRAVPYLFSVAAGVPPAIEPSILPGGSSCGRRRQFRVQRCDSGRQDAVLYGSQ